MVQVVTATAAMHAQRAPFYEEQDMRDRAKARQEDERFQEALRLAWERGEFPGQVGPVLVLRSARGRA